jgi:hypothetical protein
MSGIMYYSLKQVFPSPLFFGIHPGNCCMDNLLLIAYHYIVLVNVNGFKRFGTIK